LEIPYEMQVAWKQYSKGYKRVKVKQVVDRGLSVYEGKDSLSRHGFVNLQKKTLTVKCSYTERSCTSTYRGI
jgi:hypothetical protein